MEIKTQRLTLRPIGPEYLLSTYAYAGDRENTRWMMFLPLESLTEARQWLQSFADEWQRPCPKAYEFAILHNGIHIGEAGADFFDRPDAAELGWVLHPAYQGRGYATEAARGIVDFIAEHLGIRHFIAHCDAENAASQRVMRKLGMALTDATRTRKNRASDLARRELEYELWVT